MRAATRHPAPVIAGCLAAGIVCVSLVPAGIVELALLPSADGDTAIARVEMAEGTPAALTERMARDVEAAGLRAIEAVSASRPPDAEPLVAGISRVIGLRPHRYGGSAVQEASVSPPAHIATVEFKLLSGARRDVAAATIVQAWREEAAALTGARNVTVSAELIDLGAPVLVELSHPDPARLGPASGGVDRSSPRTAGRLRHAVGPRRDARGNPDRAAARKRIPSALPLMAWRASCVPRSSATRLSGCSAAARTSACTSACR